MAALQLRAFLYYYVEPRFLKSGNVWETCFKVVVFCESCFPCIENKYFSVRMYKQKNPVLIIGFAMYTEVPLLLALFVFLAQ